MKKLKVTIDVCGRDLVLTITDPIYRNPADFIEAIMENFYKKKKFFILTGSCGATSVRCNDVRSILIEEVVD